MYDENEYNGEYEDSYSKEERSCDKCNSPFCTLHREVQVAQGVLAWLCFDCRKEWHNRFRKHPIQKKYSEAAMRLDFWKARVDSDSEDEDLDEGLELLKTVEDLESQIDKIAEDWIG